MKIVLLIATLPPDRKAELLRAGEVRGDRLVIEADVFERVAAGGENKPGCGGCGD